MAHLAEDQCRLTAEESFFPSGKEMVKIGEHSVQLIGVGIPEAKQRHLTRNAQQDGQATGLQAIQTPEGKGDDKSLNTS